MDDKKLVKTALVRIALLFACFIGVLLLIAYFQNAANAP